MGNKVTTLYRDRCNNDCSRKTYDRCADEYMPKLTCNTQQYTTKIEYCDLEGVNMNQQNPGGRCPNNFYCQTHNDSDIICGMSTLFDGDIGKQIADNNKLKLAYVGMMDNGYSLTFPYYNQFIHYQNGILRYCESYDPRTRDWFINAITGQKNVVILLDNSTSICIQGQGDKLKIAIDTIKSLLVSLNYLDSFQLVYFSQNSTVETIGSPDEYLLASKDNIELAINKLNEIQCNLSIYPNFQAQFEKAFTLFHQWQDNLNDGQLIIHHINGGNMKRYSIPEDQQDFLIFISQKQLEQSNSTGILNQKKVSIFNFLVLEENNREEQVDFLRQLSCENSGIYYNIREQRDQNRSLSIISSYFTYLSQSRSHQQESNGIFWTKSYKDFSTQKDVFTASYSIIYEQKLIAVVGIDIAKEDLENFPLYEIDMENKHHSTVNLFSINDKLDECDLEQLRGEGNTCQVENCTFLVNNDNCSRINKNHPFYLRSETTYQQLLDKNCCFNHYYTVYKDGDGGLTVLAQVLIGTFSGIIFIVAFIYCKKVYLKNIKGQGEDQNKQNNQSKENYYRQPEQQYQELKNVQQQKPLNNV